jgi:hypothetical protein
VAAPAAPTTADLAEAVIDDLARQAAAPAAPAAPVGFILYVGCAPIGSGVINALEYADAAHEELKKLHGVAHYREMEYGKGPGELCKALQHVFTMVGVPGGDVVLGDTHIEQDTAAVWLSQAAKVVRAFR